MRTTAQPDPSVLVAALDLATPLIGFYDAPDPGELAPLVEPSAKSDRGACVFHFFQRWLKGETLHLTAANHGCGGCGRAFFGIQARERDAFIDFLWADEGLRASRQLMADWVDNAPTYRPEHDHIFVGPLKPRLGDYLKTVTLWVNPDQLSVLQQCVYYHHAWGEPDPVTVPFGSGCSELVVPFRSLEQPQAVIGGTDVAMRNGLPANLLAFTVTVPMFARLCGLDEKSFLGKGFLARLRAARHGSLA